MGSKERRTNHCTREAFLLGLSWLFALAGPLSALAPTFLAASLTLLARERQLRLGLAVALLSPWGLAFVAGAWSYWTGTGIVSHRGSASSRQEGLDRVTRAPLVVGVGCLPRGNEWVWGWPSTLGLRLTARLFGPMPGSYDGPFPDEAEVRQILSDGTSWQGIHNGVAVVDGELYVLDSELVEWVEDCFEKRPWEEKHSKFVPLDDSFRDAVRGGLYGDAVLVFGHGVSAVAVDLRNGKAFAYYGYFHCDEGGVKPPEWTDPTLLPPDAWM